ncbi:recombinase family protein [Bradyrhizobium canariense]|uniref:recombinase family protein n=1 Tax=Bradyrhizobium canariense TaxID=255045 RepID=UPI001FEBC11A|nr:recombinase family protein [Bradyrhizobium canariense]
MKIALYARYSSDNQRDESIEDQLRLCRLHAEKQGWTVADSYTDRAISGASLLRPGIQELISDAMRGKFAVVLAEAMDRLSRDQEDIAGLFKRMAFAGVRIVTLGRRRHASPRRTEGHDERPVLEGLGRQDATRLARSRRGRKVRRRTLLRL